MEIKCPHFQSSKARKIKCAGMVPDTATYIMFQGEIEEAQGNKEGYMEAYCSSTLNYRSCPMYQAIMQSRDDAHE